MSNSDSPFQQVDVINYHFEGVNFDFKNSDILSLWLKLAISSNNKNLHSINYIFCNDHYLHEMNVKYLDHDTLTDVITFPYTEGDKIEGDIFISIDRVEENAEKMNIPLENELHRVMIHGLLHLLGFNDKTKGEKEKMTEKENNHLTILNEMMFDKN